MIRKFMVMGACLLLAGAAWAGRYANVSVTSYISDFDASGVAYYVQSDGQAGPVHGVTGEYDDGQQGVSSILTANTYNSLPPGDWQLILTSSTRRVTLTFTTANAVQPGDPAYTAPANPPFWGTQSVVAKVQDDCTGIKLDPGTMTAGQTIQCPFDINQIPSGQSGVTYSLAMTGSWANAPESTFVQIQCNSNGSDGKCNDWFVDPIPVVNADGTTSPGRAIARLNQNSTSRGTTTRVDEGDFYMTFHFHMTRP